MQILRTSLAILAGVGIGIATLATLHADTRAPATDDSSTTPPKIETTAAQSFTLTWPSAAPSGDCLEQAGATLTLNSDGTATWQSQVSSSYSDDSFCHNLRVLDKNGTVIWSWERLCSSTLSSTPRTWTANSAFPASSWPHFVKAQRDNHC
jgi:hypothetical protein